MSKVKHIVAVCAFLSPFLCLAEGANSQKSWLLMADYQYRASDAISRSGGVQGEYGRSRSGVEAIYQTDTASVDLEYYLYHHRFSGAVLGTDRAYGDTSDLMLTGYKQWRGGPKYGVQLIYALEAAAEESLSLEDGLRWGLGAAVRWQPDAETDVALGVLLEDRLESSLLPIPYLKAVWRPCHWGEVELRATGLQNGIIFRGFPSEDRATSFDFSVLYETLTFQLAEGSYGSRAVAIGEVPIRIGVTQFLESSGTWFIRVSGEWVPFARHSFKHQGQARGAFEPGGTWGMAARLGARF